MIKKEELSKYIGNIGYDIIDNIISPVCGIDKVIADLYLADIQTYTFGDKKENNKIIKQVEKKYNIKLEYPKYFLETPLALLALYILECSDYLNKQE